MCFFNFEILYQIYFLLKLCKGKHNKRICNLTNGNKRTPGMSIVYTDGYGLYAFLSLRIDIVINGEQCSISLTSFGISSL